MNLTAIVSFFGHSFFWNHISYLGQYSSDSPITMASYSYNSCSIEAPTVNIELPLNQCSI